MVHTVLERQLRKVGARTDSPPTIEQWQALLERVDAAYVQEDNARYTLERAIAISSQEMADLNLRLATERDRLHATVTSLPEGLCLLSAGGLVEIANRAAEQMLGSEPRGLTGRDFVAHVGGICELHELSEAVRNGQTHRCDDAYFMTLDRRPLRVSFALTPVLSRNSFSTRL